MQLKKSLAGAAVCAAAFAFALSGCVNTQVTIGNSDGASQKITITDSSGKDVEAVYVKDSTQPEFGDALELSGIWADTDEAQLYCPQLQEGATYDVKVDCTDGSYYEMWGLELGEMNNAKLRIDATDDTAYLEYVDASGQTVTTVAAQQAYLEKTKADKKEARAAAAAQAKAERQAKKAAKIAAKKKAAKIAAKKAAAKEKAEEAAKEKAAKEAAEKDETTAETTTSTQSAKSSSSTSKTKSGSTSNSSAKKTSSNSSKKTSSTGSKKKSSDTSGSKKTDKQEDTGGDDTGATDENCVDDLL